MMKSLSLLLVLWLVLPKANGQNQQDTADVQRRLQQDAAIRAEQQRRAAAAQAQANSINPSAITGNNSQNSAAGANNAAGAALIATGTALMMNPPTVPPGAALVAMGILALMQGAHDKDAANRSAATARASQLSGATYTNPVDPSGTVDYSKVPEIVAAQKKLAAAGYKMTEKGLTHPDGKFTPASAFSSAASMKAAGLDASAIQEAQKVVGAINDDPSKFKVSSVAVDGEGGGGSAASASSSADEGAAAAMVNPFDLNANQKQSLVAGKTLNFDGEPIGVAGTNIFDLIHTAYQTRRSGRQFIETDALPGVAVSVRAPASASMAPAGAKPSPAETIRGPNR